MPKALPGDAGQRAEGAPHRGEAEGRKAVEAGHVKTLESSRLRGLGAHGPGWKRAAVKLEHGRHWAERGVKCGPRDE